MSSKPITYTQSISLPPTAPLSLVLSRLQDVHFLLSLQPLIQSDQPSRNSFLNDKTLISNDSAARFATSNPEDTDPKTRDAGDQAATYTYRNLVLYTRIVTAVAYQWRAKISKLADGARVVTEAPKDVQVVEVWKVEGTATAMGNRLAGQKEKVGETAIEEAAGTRSEEGNLTVQRKITIEVKNGWWYGGRIKKEVEDGLDQARRAVVEWIEDGLQDGREEAGIDG